MAVPPFVQGWSGTSKGAGTITAPDVEPSGGPNIGLVAIITIRDAAATSVVTGVAYAGSEAFGKAHDVQYFGDARVEFWVLTGPAAESGDVVATLSGTPNACIWVGEYTGVDQTTPIGAVSAPAGSTGASSQTWTITTQHADSRIVSGVSYGTSIGTLSWTSPEEHRLFIETGTSGTDNQGLMGDRAAPTPGGYTISAQVSAQSHEWSCGTIELRAATDTGVTGSGDLVAGDAAAAGSGVSGSTGSGDVAAGAAAADGAGVTGSAGAGDLLAGAATVEGAGTVGFVEITGSGALEAGDSAVEGAGASGSTGTGSLASQAAAAAGAGGSGSTGTGDVAAQPSTVEGAGVTGSTGAGALQAQPAVVRGTAENIVTGSGALQAGGADAAGAGLTGSTGAGDIAAGAATADGAGETGSTGQGALVIDFATAAGAGRSGSVGSGDLLAGNAVIVGFDVPAVTFGRVSATVAAATAVSTSARLATGLATDAREVTGLEATESAA